MSRPLRVTFYSYKGGVGRTLALLQVAERIARFGRRVIVIDLDLEAPGIGLSKSTGPDNHARSEAHPGVSDIVLDLLDDQPPDCDLCSYTLFGDVLGERLRVVPVGTEPLELANRVPSLYRDMADESATVFQRMVLHLEARFKPDFIFIDSRTGLSDVAGVCTVELPHLVVAVAGLNDQNRTGMRDALDRVRRHPSRHPQAATMLVLSPVPRPDGLEGASEAINRLRIDAAPLTVLHPLLHRLDLAEKELLVPILRDHGARDLDRYYPRVERRALLHWLQYDPWVPLLGEFQVRDPDLKKQYDRLFEAVMAFGDLDVPILSEESAAPPWLVSEDRVQRS